jgi:hypothetical protein
MQNLNRQSCPQCGNQKLKSWKELTSDEKILIEKLPAAADFKKEERQRNHWCGRCWHEFISDKDATA